MSNKEFASLYAEAAQEDMAKIRAWPERVAELEAENKRLRAALYPFAVTADKLDQVRAKAPIMVKEYEASASVVGWRYEDAARARAVLSQEDTP